MDIIREAFATDDEKEKKDYWGDYDSCGCDDRCGCDN